MFPGFHDGKAFWAPEQPLLGCCILLHTVSGALLKKQAPDVLGDVSGRVFVSCFDFHDGNDLRLLKRGISDACRVLCFCAVYIDAYGLP